MERVFPTHSRAPRFQTLKPPLSISSPVLQKTILPTGSSRSQFRKYQKIIDNNSIVPSPKLSSSHCLLIKKPPSASVEVAVSEEMDDTTGKMKTVSLDVRFYTNTSKRDVFNVYCRLATTHKIKARSHIEAMYSRHYMDNQNRIRH